jgi:hypothetical protein
MVRKVGAVGQKAVRYVALTGPKRQLTANRYV